MDLQFIAARMARFIGEKCSRWLVLRGTVSFLLAAGELFFVSAVLQGGLALPMAYYFHRATTIGVPSNIAVVPLMQLLMPTAVAAIALGSISPGLAKIPVLITGFALHGIIGTVHELGSLRAGDLRVPMPSLGVIALAAAALVAAMSAARHRAAFVMMGLSAILMVSLVVAFVPPRPRVHAGVLEVTSIDVGEGDSTAPADHASREDLARRCWRSNRAGRIATRLRRGCGLPLSLDARHLTA